MADAALLAAEEEAAQQAARKQGYSGAAAAAARHLELEREELEAAHRHEQCCAAQVCGTFGTKSFLCTTHAAAQSPRPQRMFAMHVN